MNISFEEKKQEAVDRMKLWGIFGQTIQQFRRQGLVSVSEPPMGAFYWVDEEERKRLDEFEKEHNALVYMVVRSFTQFGTLDAYLYVSDYKEEWPQDRTDIKEGQQCCYVYNQNDEWCSEFGSVGLELTPAGGLKRTW